MFPYTVKYTESESDIQICNLLYKNRPNTPKYFRKFGNCWKRPKTFYKFKFLFCVLYKLHNSCFVFFVKFVSLGFWDFYIYIYITRVGLLHV